MRTSLLFSLVASAAFVIGGCILNVHEGTARDDSGYGSGTPTLTSSTSTTPMLVEIDPDAKMAANPGEGVGVFAEYATGGQWTVWWTCDTNRTRQSCDYDIGAVAETGAMRDVTSENIDEPIVVTATGWRATTVTGAKIATIRFRTDPGAVIELNAKFSGVNATNILFFIQDGVVNGGYDGTLTNPIRFVGKSS